MRIAEFNAPAAENILKIINDKGLKQKAVAEKAGYSRQQFSDMLNGRKIIRPFDTMAIAVALGVDANALFAKQEAEGEVRKDE